MQIDRSGCDQTKPTLITATASAIKPNTRASILTSCARGECWTKHRQQLDAPVHKHKPNAAASVASTIPSTNNCLTICQRLAPSYPYREFLLPLRRTHQQQICHIRTRDQQQYNPTENSSTSNARRAPPTISSCKGVTLMCQPPSSPFGPR